MKSLIPVLITPSSYHSGVTVNNSDISSRITTSTFKSTGTRFCNYTSFEQILPILAEREKQLSTLFPQEGISVFQYLTSQLYYKIEWKLTNNTSVIPTYNVRYLTLDVERQIAPEPWDANGDRIVMTSPQPGKSTHGCFIIPGQYLFFVIEDKNRFLDIELNITGFASPCSDAWNVFGCRKSCFAIYLNNKKVKTYTNTLSNVGLIERTLNPDFVEFERRILGEYYSNPGLPCILENNDSLRDIPDTDKTVTISYKYTSEQDLRKLTVFTNYLCSGGCCDQSYTNAPLTIVVKETQSRQLPNWIRQGADKTQFFIDPAIEYKVSNIKVNGTTPVFNDPVLYSGPFYGCDSTIDGVKYNAPFFTIFDVGKMEPVKFVKELSSVNAVVKGQTGIILPTNSSIDNSTFSFPDSSTASFNFIVVGYAGDSKQAYATRLLSPSWYINVHPNDVDNPSSGIIYKFSPGTLEVSFDLTYNVA